MMYLYPQLDPQCTSSQAVLEHTNCGTQVLHCTRLWRDLHGVQSAALRNKPKVCCFSNAQPSQSRSVHDPTVLQQPVSRAGVCYIGDMA